MARHTRVATKGQNKNQPIQSSTPTAPKPQQVPLKPKETFTPQIPKSLPNSITNKITPQSIRSVAAQNVQTPRPANVSHSLPTNTPVNQISKDSKLGMGIGIAIIIILLIAILFFVMKKKGKVF